MRHRFVAKILTVLVTLGILFQATALAENPYHEYLYDENQNDQAAAPGFMPETVIDGQSLGIDAFASITDVYVKNNKVYILDTKKNRVIVTDDKFQLVQQITFTNENGEALTFGEAKGVFVDDQNRILVADEGNGAVYICDISGKVIKTLTRPVSDIIPEDFQFKPLNVLVDQAGLLYVVSEGSTRGSLQFDENYNFLGFFGSQRVAMTPELAIKLFWRKFMTKAQTDTSELIVPTVFVNADIGADGYIYTVANPEDNKNQVTKLNAMATNILSNSGQWPKDVFGDSQEYFDSQLGWMRTQFADITVDEDGFIYALDRTRGRIFMYNQDSSSVAIFGGSSRTESEKQIGMFHEATALDTLNGKVLVADSANNNITVFRETDFMVNLKKAIALTSDGLYDQAGPYWLECAKYDANNMTINSGLGKYYEEIGDYKAALKYEKLAYDQKAYSHTFKVYRDNLLNKYFPLIMLAIILIIIVPMIVSKIRSKHKKDEYSVHRRVGQYPLFCLFHPFKAYTDMKYEKKGSVPIATAIVFVYFVVQVLSKTVTGFQFDKQVADIMHFNMLSTFLNSVGGIFLWTLCNWAITTLLDGEGKFSEIWVFSSYAFLPQIVVNIPVILLSNILTNEESMFLTILVAFGNLWFAISMLMAIKEVHQFSMLKTIACILLTILGILLVICIAAIVYSMFMQLIGFISTVVNEIALRL